MVTNPQHPEVRYPSRGLFSIIYIIFLLYLEEGGRVGDLRVLRICDKSCHTFSLAFVGSLAVNYWQRR